MPPYTCRSAITTFLFYVYNFRHIYIPAIARAVESLLRIQFVSTLRSLSLRSIPSNKSGGGDQERPRLRMRFSPHHSCVCLEGSIADTKILRDLICRLFNGKIDSIPSRGRCFFLGIVD